MTNSKNGPGRKRPGKNVFTTKSGNMIKLNRSLGERLRARKEAKARQRAAYLSTLPKNKFKRILYRLHPKRVIKYWFSREGALMAFKITGVGIAAGFILLVGVFAYFRKDLPNLKDISGANLGGTITYYDRSGKEVLWQDYDAVKRVPVTSDNISNYIKQATIAVEDKDFYKHGAFDVTGIMRAGIADITGGARQGGSTITQQLVKMSREWTYDQTLSRKVKELILSVELEREYSKNDILTGYLNIAPYSGIQYGVEAAARDYFGISAKELTLAQSAMLAAIPKSPTYLSPYSDFFDRVKFDARYKDILNKMVAQKMITKAQADEAKKTDIVATVKPLPTHYQGIKAPYFVLAAKSQLELDYGENTYKRGGWKVTTTVDMNLQRIAEEQVSRGLRQVTAQNGNNIAFAATDIKTGQMVALVGGVDFTNKQFGETNFAQIPLPPGSSFKPYDYVAMINESTNVGAGSVLYDEKAPVIDPATRTGYDCTNTQDPRSDNKNTPANRRANCLWDYDFNFPGPITLRYALGGSRNVPAVKAMLTVGVDKTISIAESLGLDSGYKCYYDEFNTREAPCYGSSAIGDGAFLHLDEHVNGYATLSRLGVKYDKTYILKITDSKNKDIYEWSPPKGKQVLKPDSAYIVLDMMADPNASYLPASYKAHRYKGWHYGLKTGTTNDNKDGWMMGVSPQYAAGVWVGDWNRQNVLRGSMETMTQPIIKGWMNAAHDALPSSVKPSGWTAPPGIKTLPAFRITSKVSRLGEVIPSPNTDLFPSWYQPPKQANSASQTIDKISNKVATSCTPELAKQTNSNGNDSVFSVDIFRGRTGSSATTATDDIHKCSDAKPNVTLTAPDTCGGVGDPCEFTVTVTQGTHPLSSSSNPGTVNLYVNGQKVQSQSVSDSPSSVTFTYTPTASGSATIEAQVVDSVLYSANSSASVTLIGPATTDAETDN
jgi:membrane peptidoglycan carboxypeptidase